MLIKGINLSDARKILFVLSLATLSTLVGCAAELNLKSGTASVDKKELLVDCTAPVPTNEGEVVGKLVGSDTCTWQGVPFADDASGDNRFRAPQPVKPYGVLDATDYKPDCTQPFLENLAPGGGSEDCLHLNIWRPAVDHDGYGVNNLPVMVFIYGGGFLIGGGSWFIYEGSDLARNGVVVVTINYRLGPMGYLSLDALAAEDENSSTGAYGTLDQVAALEWVHANIKQFGGNPDNITYFGESAGAISTCQMISSPLTSGLFNRAIMESGNCVAGLPEKSFADTVSFIAAAGCPVSGPETVSCLRETSSDDLWSAVSDSTAFSFWPHVDGHVLPKQPIDALEDGTANKIDLMAGYNDDEFTILRVLPAFSKTRQMSWDAFGDLVAEEFGRETADIVLSTYDLDKFPTPVELWADVLEDLIFTCSSIGALDALAPSNRTWMYNFSVDPGAFDIEPHVGSFHFLETNFVFGNFEFLQILFHNEDAAERLTNQSAMIQRYWTRFARTGDPNGGQDPVWREYGPSKDVINLDEAPEMLDDEKQAACAHWNSIAPRDNNGLFEFMARLEFYDVENISYDLPF